MTDIETAEPPTHNEKMRETIKQAVGSIATDGRSMISELHKRLDELDRLLIASIERASNIITEHADLCGEVQQEVARLSSVIGTLHKTQTDISTQLNGYPHEQHI
jgi:ABC-type transporter Mla subunit MlaD